MFLLRLLEGLTDLLILFRADQLLVIQGLLAVVIRLCLAEVQLGQPDPALCGTQTAHLRDDLDLGDHLSLGDLLAGLFVEFGNDAADLRLDRHLVARHDLAGHDGRAGHVGHFGFQHFIADLLRTGAAPEEGERPDEQDGQETEDQILLELFHISYLLLSIRPA